VHLQVLGKEIADGVILFLYDEVRGIRHAGHRLLLDLLFAIGEKKELEPVRICN
jgi:hypothetical protein